MQFKSRETTAASVKRLHRAVLPLLIALAGTTAAAQIRCTHSAGGFVCFDADGKTAVAPPQEYRGAAPILSEQRPDAASAVASGSGAAKTKAVDPGAKPVAPPAKVPVPGTAPTAVRICSWENGKGVTCQ